jgi:NTE family protein
MESPDVLVLGAGGPGAATWMADVLAARGLDLTRVEHVVGTSTGALLAAELLAGEPPAPKDREDRESGPLLGGQIDGPLWRRLAEPAVPLALKAVRPVSTRLRAVALARVEPRDGSLEELHDRVAAMGLAFDGRLRICTLDRGTGRRVVFGAPGAPEASVAEAVTASCSAPWQHRPVRIGERDYIDGALWSPTNLDAAPALRETRVLCLAPTFDAPAARAAATGALALESAVLRRRGALLEVVTPAAPGDA